MNIEKDNQYNILYSEDNVKEDKQKYEKVKKKQ